jgi:5-methylthioribose kinase
MTTPLTAESALEYVKNSSVMGEFFSAGDVLKADPIAEGNVNLLFRVYAAGNAANKSVLVKQALPYAWRYPDFKMPLDRQRIEYEIISVEARCCPNQVPEIYLYDEENHILVIEFLGRHTVMREGLMAQKRYPHVARHMGLFMARTLFYTSDLFLSSAEKKAMVPQFINPVLCKVQEDLVFTQPYMAHENNRYTPPLAAQVQAIYANDELRSAVYMLKEAYMSHAQALLHNDLHTGSIMLNEEETKVIDPEFGFYGPMGHDVGSYLGNLALGYAAQEYHAQDEAERADYRAWIAETIRETWHIFEAEFMTLWENEGNGEWASPRFRQDYMRRLLHDTAGFGATEMMRRLIGMAHVHDFWTIEDEQIRATAESRALNMAQDWLMNRGDYDSIDDLVNGVVTAVPSI